MPTVIRHDGVPVQLPDSSSTWANTGGVFTGATGTNTYFPIPGICSQQLRTIGYYTVPTKYAHRADLIAKELYQSEDYWWLVLWASQITDPFQLGVGTRIRVLDLSEVLSAIN